MFPRKPRAPTSGTGGGHSRCRAKGMQVGGVEVANSNLQQEAQPRRNIHGGRAPARPGGYPIYHPQHEPGSHGEMVLRKRGKAGSWLDRSWGPLQGNVNWDPSPIMPRRRQADRLRDSGLRDRLQIGPAECFEHRSRCSWARQRGTPAHTLPPAVTIVAFWRAASGSMLRRGQTQRLDPSEPRQNPRTRTTSAYLRESWGCPPQGVGTDGPGGEVEEVACLAKCKPVPDDGRDVQESIAMHAVARGEPTGLKAFVERCGRGWTSSRPVPMAALLGLAWGPKETGRACLGCWIEAGWWQ